jgi:hypothetical protein
LLLIGYCFVLYNSSDTPSLKGSSESNCHS